MLSEEASHPHEWIFQGHLQTQIVRHGKFDYGSLALCVYVHVAKFVCTACYKSLTAVCVNKSGGLREDWENKVLVPKLA